MGVVLVWNLLSKMGTSPNSKRKKQLYFAVMYMFGWDFSSLLSSYFVYASTCWMKKRR